MSPRLSEMADNIIRLIVCWQLTQSAITVFLFICSSSAIQFLFPLLFPGASGHWGDGDRLVRQPGQSEAVVEAGPRVQESHRLHHAKGSWWRPPSVLFPRSSLPLTHLHRYCTVCTHIRLKHTRMPITAILQPCNKKSSSIYLRYIGLSRDQAKWEITLGWPRKPQVHNVSVAFWLFDGLHICLGICTTEAQYQLLH